jgi:hypothetical protein
MKPWYLILRTDLSRIMGSTLPMGSTTPAPRSPVQTATYPERRKIRSSSLAQLFGSDPAGALVLCEILYAALHTRFNLPQDRFLLT